MRRRAILQLSGSAGLTFIAGEAAAKAKPVLANAHHTN